MWVQKHVTSTLVKTFGHAFPPLAAMTHLALTKDKGDLPRLRCQPGGLGIPGRIKGKERKGYETFEGKIQLQLKIKYKT